MIGSAPSRALRPSRRASGHPLNLSMSFSKNVLKKKLRIKADKELIERFMEIRELPRWHRGMAPPQLKACDGLFFAIRNDIFQWTCHRVSHILDQIGISPNYSKEDLMFLLNLCRGNDIAFLWFLMEMIFPLDEESPNSYDIDQQLILSSIAHLDMIPTLRELDRVLPPGPSKTKYERQQMMEKKKQRRQEKRKNRDETAEVSKATLELVAKECEALNRLSPNTKPKELKDRLSWIYEHRPILKDGLRTLAKSHDVSPYFKKMRRPQLYGKDLQLPRPGFKVDVPDYKKYKDPSFLLPGESNRWFAHYELTTSARVAALIVHDLVTTIGDLYDIPKREAAAAQKSEKLRLGILRSNPMCSHHRDEWLKREAAQFVTQKERCARLLQTHMSLYREKKRRKLMQEFRKEVDMHRLEFRMEQLARNRQEKQNNVHVIDKHGDVSRLAFSNNRWPPALRLLELKKDCHEKLEDGMNERTKLTDWLIEEQKKLRVHYENESIRWRAAKKEIPEVQEVGYRKKKISKDIWLQTIKKTAVNERLKDDMKGKKKCHVRLKGGMEQTNTFDDRGSNVLKEVAIKNCLERLKIGLDQEKLCNDFVSQMSQESAVKKDCRERLKGGMDKDKTGKESGPQVLKKIEVKKDYKERLKKGGLDKEIAGNDLGPEAMKKCAVTKDRSAVLQMRNKERKNLSDSRFLLFKKNSETNDRERLLEKKTADDRQVQLNTATDDRKLLESGYEERSSFSVRLKALMEEWNKLNLEKNGGKTKETSIRDMKKKTKINGSPSKLAIKPAVIRDFRKLLKERNNCRPEGGIQEKNGRQFQSVKQHAANSCREQVIGDEEKENKPMNQLPKKLMAKQDGHHKRLEGGMEIENINWPQLVPNMGGGDFDSFTSVLTLRLEEQKRKKGKRMTSVKRPTKKLPDNVKIPPEPDVSGLIEDDPKTFNIVKSHQFQVHRTFADLREAIKRYIDVHYPGIEFNIDEFIEEYASSKGINLNWLKELINTNDTEQTAKEATTEWVDPRKSVTPVHKGPENSNAVNVAVKVYFPFEFAELNDELESPTPSETFFCAPTMHKPFNFDYNKIFAVETNRNKQRQCADQQKESKEIENPMPTTQKPPKKQVNKRTAAKNNRKIRKSVKCLNIHNILEPPQPKKPAEEPNEVRIRFPNTDLPLGEQLGNLIETRSSPSKDWTDSLCAYYQIHDEVEKPTPKTPEVEILNRMPKRTYYDCDDTELMDKMLRVALESLSLNRRLVLPTLQDVHKLPVLRDFIAQRYGKVLTVEQRLRDTELSMRLAKAIEKVARGIKLGHRHKATLYMDADDPQLDCVKKALAVEKRRFQQHFSHVFMDETRNFWFALRPCGYPDKAIRNAFYAYMPGRERDICYRFRVPKAKASNLQFQLSRRLAI